MYLLTRQRMPWEKRGTFSVGWVLIFFPRHEKLNDEVNERGKLVYYIIKNMPNTILDFCIYCVIFICEETGIQDYIVKAKCICLMHSEAKKKKKKKKRQFGGGPNKENGQFMLKRLKLPNRFQERIFFFFGLS